MNKICTTCALSSSSCAQDSLAQARPMMPCISLFVVDLCVCLYMCLCLSIRQQVLSRTVVAVNAWNIDKYYGFSGQQDSGAVGFC